MFSRSNSNTIKKAVKEFFERMTFDVEVGVDSPEENIFQTNLKMEEPQALIGQGGETLAEIQHLLKIILYKKLGETIFFDLDINDYKKKKIEYLKQLARETADDVSLSKKEKILPPMPAFERRVIHLELSSRQDVKTESTGEGEERRIAVKPVF